MKKNSLSLFLNAEYHLWKGLPSMNEKQLKNVLGEPTHLEEVYLGYYTSQKLTYLMPVLSGGIHAYIRDNQLIMIEAIKTPSYALVDTLTEPCGEKLQEILVNGAYVSEQLYCQIGLILSVATFFEDSNLPQIVRIRSIKSFENPNEFDERYYKSFSNQIKWS